MQIELLGHGGAFDESSTSYLVDNHILIDCGPDIVKKLLLTGRLNDVDTLYVTHTHQDHVGGLELLVYYTRFVSRRTLKVFGSNAFWSYYKALACITEEDKSGLDAQDFYKLVCPLNSIVLADQPRITAFPVTHSGLEAYGFVVRNEHGDYAVISGDVDSPLSDQICWKDPRLKYVFHDAGWTGIESDDHKVHPRAGEITGDLSKLVLVHTYKDTPGFRHALTGDIFKL